jgi:flagellar basal-body rod modification protein FlgD
MTVVPPVSSTPAANTQSTTDNKNATLDKDGFLKIFIAQMSNQDPSSQQDPGQSVQQMATFTMVEQLMNLGQQNTAMQVGQQTTAAVGLIGKTVTYLDKTGPHTGIVESVATNKDSAPTLTVDGQAGVDPTTITQVAPTGAEKE